MSDDRRKTRRARLAGVRATYEGGSGEIQQADVVDLSCEGVFLETTSPLAVGKRIALEIYVTGEAAPWSALGRVVWSRPDSQGEGRPRGMAVKLIDVDDSVAQAIAHLVDTREQTEPGVGDVEAPPREQTILGVGTAVAPKPIGASVPGATRQGGLRDRAQAVAAPGAPSASVGEPAMADQTIAIDLVARKPDDRLRATEPPSRGSAKRRRARAEEDKVVIPKRRGGGWFLLVVLVLAVGAAAYVYRDRLRQVEIIRSWVSQVGGPPSAPSP